VSRFTTRAFEIAGDPDVDLGAGPFAPAKLYYTATPRSYRDLVPGLRDRRADIGGRQLSFVGVPDDQITTEVDIKAWLSRKRDALACHRTQFDFDPETGRPKTFASELSEAEQIQLFGRERFVLAMPVGWIRPPAREADLFAGVALNYDKSGQV